jgi:hypothetical protein
MGRWSPTVQPIAVSPFWDSFNGELARTLQASPDQAIAWDRNRIAKQEADRRTQRDADERPLRLEQSGYAPVTEEDYNLRQVGDANAPALRSDAPSTQLGGETWQYAPGKALTRQNALTQQATLQGIRTRMKGAGEVERAINEERGTNRPLAFGVDVNGQDQSRAPNPFAYHLSEQAKTEYALTGRMPYQSRYGASSAKLQVKQAADGSYMTFNPATGEWTPSDYRGEPVMAPRRAGPARTEEQRREAADQAYFRQRYSFYLKPDKWGVAMKPEEARRRANADVAADRASRLSAELGPDDEDY